jgi:hypothetical protein
LEVAEVVVVLIMWMELKRVVEVVAVLIHDNGIAD